MLHMPYIDPYFYVSSWIGCPVSVGLLEKEKMPIGGIQGYLRNLSTDITANHNKMQDVQAQ